jgi:hypothetical protein
MEAADRGVPDPAGNRTLALQAVARRYTDWATTYKGRFKKEFYNGNPNAIVWRVLWKKFILKA